MATFGVHVARSEAMPNSGKVKTHRDESWLPDYVNELRSLKSQGEGIVGIATIDPAEFKVERNRFKLAGKRLTDDNGQPTPMVVGLRKRAGGRELLYWLEFDKAVPQSSYDKDKAEATKLGLSVKEYREQRKAESGASTTNGKRGRPRKSEPALAAV